ncbi:hypothetical protein Cob_v010508 [Colletotrichum orbiculare MAFF 240422]|uniref:Uncharacterized protein n=1 Tax=Colletotrichum orbiculare (strain 104-T / ATCC 96160 / CBS 514.97 / LARS 414 / MAFF 240422) TaxID=1213857 RepID=A0A484FFY4_COLOR|nr:hypothetical protein Cob_v010508 [Colletotrichum orbiculare MAFF 240422]
MYGYDAVSSWREGLTEKIPYPRQLLHRPNPDRCLGPRPQTSTTPDHLPDAPPNISGIGLFEPTQLPNPAILEHSEQLKRWRSCLRWYPKTIPVFFQPHQSLPDFIHSSSQTPAGDPCCPTFSDHPCLPSHPIPFHPIPHDPWIHFAAGPNFQPTSLTPDAS